MSTSSGWDDRQRLCPVHTSRFVCFWHRRTRTIMCSRCLMERAASHACPNIDDISAIESVAVDEAHQFLVMFPERLEDLQRIVATLVRLLNIVDASREPAVGDAGSCTERLYVETLVAMEASLCALVAAFSDAVRTTDTCARIPLPACGTQTSGKCTLHASRSLEWWREHDGALLCSRCLMQASVHATQEGLVVPIEDAVEAKQSQLQLATHAARSVLKLQGSTLKALVCAATPHVAHTMMTASQELLERATTVLEALERGIAVGRPSSETQVAPTCQVHVDTTVAACRGSSPHQMIDDAMANNIAVMVIEQLLDDDDDDGSDGVVYSPSIVDTHSSSAEMNVIRQLAHNHPTLVAGRGTTAVR